MSENCIGGTLSTDAGFPKVPNVGLGDGDGVVGGLSTDAGFPKVSNIGLGADDGVVGGLSTDAGFPKVSNVGLGADDGVAGGLSTDAGAPKASMGFEVSSKFAGTQVGLNVGLNDGKSSRSWTGLPLVPRGNKGQIGGCVGVSDSLVPGWLDGDMEGLSTEAGFP